MSENREKLGKLGIEVSKIRGNQGKVKCPKCSEDRKNKNDPCLSVNITEGWWRCHNCDWHGSVKTFEKKEKKVYKRPSLTNQTQCSDEILKWFMARGINPAALNKAKVMSGFTWMPQTSKEEYVIQYTYFRQGIPVNIKHRDAVKNFRLEKDAELIFYGLDDLKDSDEYIIIVEGENDKLAFTEAGIDYCLSVPNGASGSYDLNLDYLDNCIDYFENNKKIILAVDNDNPGMMLREELSRRLGKDRCFKVNFGKYKDANELLVGEGVQGLRKIIQPINLIKYPIAGVVEVDDVWDEVEFIMDNGLERGVTTGIFPGFDELMSFDGSKLCVVTGNPNSGKSPFVDMVAIALSIRHGWKWAYCAMEGKPLSVYITQMTEKIVGQVIRKGKTISEDERRRVRSFLQNHFYFIEANYNNNEVEKLDFILNAAEGLVKRHGIKGLIIDPWNKIEKCYAKGENEMAYVSRALDEIIRMEQKHNLFTFLVAHPTKPNPSSTVKQPRVPNLYSVSGSSDFYNKPDYGITVHRNFDSGLTEIHVNKMKWNHIGKLGTTGLRYNGGNTRLGNVSDKLDFTNWLDSLPSISTETDTTLENDYDFINTDGSLPDDAPF